MGVEIFYQQASPYYKRFLVSVFDCLVTSRRCLLPLVAGSDLCVVAVDDPGIIKGLSTDNKRFPDI